MNSNSKITLRKMTMLILIMILISVIGVGIVKGIISYAVGEDEVAPEVVADQLLILSKECEINGEQKRMIQVYVETGIESAEYPIKETTITLDTNIIEGTLEDVYVTAYEKNSYTTGTYTHSNGVLTINLINENETVEKSSIGTDIFRITYIFENTEIETIKQPLQRVDIELYSGQSLTNEIPDGNFNYTSIEIPHSYMNSNDIHKTEITDGQVEFTETVGEDLSHRLNTTNIVIEDIENTFYDNSENEIIDIDLKYKTTKIDAEALIDVLDDEGQLVITDIETGNIVLELTKEELQSLTEGVASEKTSSDEIKCNVILEDGMININYLTELENIKIELTKIKELSKSEIELAYIWVENTRIISNITSVDTLNYLTYTKNCTYEGNNENIETKITFKDTTTRADLAIDNTNWVIGEANKVKFTITLDTTTEKSDLFNNPMFLIELPANVESVNTANSMFEIKNDNYAFNNKRVFITTLMGKKYVVVSLEGQQTEETIANGNASIEITLELNVTENVAETETTAKLYYQNGMITSYENGEGFDTAEVTVDLVMENEPKDYINEGNTNGDNTSEGEETFEPTEILITLNELPSAVGNIEEGNLFSYRVCIHNGTEKNKQNLKLIGVIPEGATLEAIKEYNDTSVEEPVGVELEYNYNSETRSFSVNLSDLVEEKDVDIVLRADELPEGETYKSINIGVQLLEANTLAASSNEITSYIGTVPVEIEVENLPETIDELGEITLIIHITNKGQSRATYNTLNITIPEEINIEKYIITKIGENGEEKLNIEGKVYTQNYKSNYISLAPGDTYTEYLTGNVNYITEDKTITINGNLDEEELSWTTTLLEKVENPETPEEPENPSDPSNPDDEGNTDNPNDSGNQGGSGNQGSTGNQGGSSNQGNTGNQGGSGNQGNSGNQGSTGNQGGTTVEGFDLSLTQYINKITVTNSNGTTTYDYKDTNFAKVEIYRKLMNGSKLTIEYKIIVKNEGTIPGYARKIVDYKPQDLVFNTSQNPDWELEDDGNLYTTKFLNTLLNPGETAEMTLVLEKEMTNDNVGTITNTVEIYEARNNEDVEDINSIPGDRIEGQNDMSKTEVLVVTGTGTIILYITLATAVIAIIVLGLIRIRKITINKKGGC